MNSFAVQEQLGSARFQNALARRPQSTPPIWLMRQAGRYHKHYQALREKYSFMDLCKRPELAAEVALGPVLKLFPEFCEKLIPLLARNLEMQLDNGAELVTIFDTAAGELAPDIFETEVVPQLQALSARNASRIGYYSKGTQPAHLRHTLFTEGGFAGIGIDHRWDLREALDLFSI